MTIKVCLCLLLCTAFMNIAYAMRRYAAGHQTPPDEPDPKRRRVGVRRVQFRVDQPEYPRAPPNSPRYDNLDDVNQMEMAPNSASDDHKSADEGSSSSDLDSDEYSDESDSEGSPDEDGEGSPGEYVRDESDDEEEAKEEKSSVIVICPKLEEYKADSNALIQLILSDPPFTPSLAQWHQWDNYRAVTALLSKWENDTSCGSFIDEYDFYRGYAPLHIAIKKGKWDIVQLLLRKGADANNESLEDESTLDVFISTSPKNLLESIEVELLDFYGIVPTTTSEFTALCDKPFYAFDYETKKTYQYLLKYARANDEFMKILVQKVIEKNARIHPNKNPWNALLTIEDLLKIIDLTSIDTLIRAVPNVLITILNARGGRGQARNQLFHRCLARNAPLEEVYGPGGGFGLLISRSTALDWLVRKRRYADVELLLEKGAVVHEKTLEDAVLAFINHYIGEKELCDVSTYTGKLCIILNLLLNHHHTTYSYSSEIMKRAMALLLGNHNVSKLPKLIFFVEASPITRDILRSSEFTYSHKSGRATTSAMSLALGDNTELDHRRKVVQYLSDIGATLSPEMAAQAARHNRSMFKDAPPKIMNPENMKAAVAENPYVIFSIEEERFMSQKIMSEIIDIAVSQNPDIVQHPEWRFAAL